ncbi:MAG: sulfatase-like hydrolase/transferase, partial [Pirellulales bacterium]|nr:sulfatase-like hydrolase/transferase [Pirellulales bacterium]
MDNKSSACLLLLMPLFLSAVHQAHAGRPKPNIVVILADDIGYGDLSSYGGQIATPNIDSLATAGMKFTDAHTPAAVCAPTRFSMLTGGNPYRAGDRQGAWNNSEPSAFYINDNSANQTKTMGQVLQGAGYHTSFFGKMHLGAADLSTHGFNESSGLLRGIQNSPYYFIDGLGAIQPINPAQPTPINWPAGNYPNPDGSVSVIPKAGSGDANWDSTQIGNLLSQKAADFVQTNAPSSTPFMMYYATQAIHTPHTPPAQFDGQSVLGQTGYANRGDMIREMDLQVGRIIDAVDAAGELDNTLFVFTSDNGGGSGNSTPSSQGGPTHLHNGVLRGGKGTSYEGGLRVPFIARWGDGTQAGSIISPGSTSDALVSVNDLMATFYDLTGQAMESDQAMDSASILPVLTGASSEVRSSMYMQQNN